MIYLYREISIAAVLLFISSGRFEVLGQIDTARTSEQVKDTGSVIKKHSLFATSGFGSNMIYLGSTISRNEPFYSAGLTYGFRNSFYLTASASHIQDTDPFGAFYSLATNYIHTFNSWLDISAEISGYKPAQPLEQTLFNEFVFANFTTGFDWRILYTRISGGAVFSGKTNGFLQVTNSRYFQTHDFFKSKAFISFNPEINILFGEVYTIKTATGVKRLSYTPPFLRKRNDPPLPVITSYSSGFAPVDFQFSLPVTFSFKRLSIEADPCYILPAYTNSITQMPQGLTFYLTATFRIF